MLIEPRYLNSESEKTWPSAKYLADDLGVRPRSVQRALSYLVKHGWLTCKISRGRGHSNEYRIPSDFVTKIRRSLNDEKYDRAVVLLREGIEGKIRTPQRAATEDDSFDGPTDRQVQPAAKRSRGQPERRERKPRTPFPTDWVFGPAEEAIASEVAGWDAERVHKIEFAAFKEWAVNEDVRSRNWPNKVWEGWCKKGREIDQREGEQHARRQNGSGSRRWNGRTEPTGLAYLERQAARQAKGD